MMSTDANRSRDTPTAAATEREGPVNTEFRRKLEMAERVREFTRARATSEPSYAPVLTKFQELVTRTEQIVARQHQGRLDAKGARDRRKDLRRMLQFQLVHYLVAVGSVATKDQAELAARFKLPSTNSTNTVFLTSVKALLVVAESQRDLLVQGGMEPALLEKPRPHGRGLRGRQRGRAHGSARSHRRPGRPRGDCHRADGAGEGARRHHPLPLRKRSRSDGGVESGQAGAGSAAEWE